jgi:integrase
MESVPLYSQLSDEMRVKGVRRLGVRLGNWLTPEHGRRLLTQRTPITLREVRDHAMLAVFLGCGLRRGELLAMQLGWIQPREGALGHRRSHRQRRARPDRPHAGVGQGRD